MAWAFWIRRLAIPYFHMANCHTIIGAKRFHFRVRDGFGWFTLAMVTKQFGVQAEVLFFRFRSVSLPSASFLLCLLVLRPTLRRASPSLSRCRGCQGLALCAFLPSFYLSYGTLYLCLSRLRRQRGLRPGSFFPVHVYPS